MTEFPPLQRQKINRGKIAGGIVFVVVLGLIGYSRLRSGGKIEEILALAAREVNKSCPVFEDATTRLDSVVAPGYNQIQYHYTLTNLLRDSTDLEILFAGFESAMITNARKNPGLALFRDHEVTFLYRFNDQKGVLLTRVEIGPEKYR